MFYVVQYKMDGSLPHKLFRIRNENCNLQRRLGNPNNLLIEQEFTNKNLYAALRKLTTNLSHQQYALLSDIYYND